MHSVELGAATPALRLGTNCGKIFRSESAGGKDRLLDLQELRCVGIEYARAWQALTGLIGEQGGLGLRTGGTIDGAGGESCTGQRDL